MLNAGGALYILLFMCFFKLALGLEQKNVVDHKSPKGSVILRVTQKSVILISTADNSVLATIVSDPLELADEDGWHFESIDWNDDETICVLRNSSGSNQRYHAISVFSATSIAPATKFERVNIDPMFQAQLQKDRDRNKALNYSLHDIRIINHSEICAYYCPVGYGSAQWDDAPDLDKYEALLEFQNNHCELKKNGVFAGR